MGTRKKKRPEFELPAALIETIQDYLGPAVVNKLSSDQATELMSEATSCAAGVGRVLEGETPASD
jgi:hypothetical protein